jgi:hypothetical protein
MKEFILKEVKEKEPVFAGPELTMESTAKLIFSSEYRKFDRKFLAEYGQGMAKSSVSRR